MSTTSLDGPSFSDLVRTTTATKYTHERLTYSMLSHSPVKYRDQHMVL